MGLTSVLFHHLHLVVISSVLKNYQNPNSSIGYELLFLSKIYMLKSQRTACQLFSSFSGLGIGRKTTERASLLEPTGFLGRQCLFNVSCCARLYTRASCIEIMSHDFNLKSFEMKS